MSGTTATPATAPALHYDGRVGEIYPIFLLNLLLTIVTLGIFRFWAVTRMRRYLWSRMSFQGSRLEYTGTGGELFVGFLLAGLLLVGLGVAAFAMAFALGSIDQSLVFIPFVLFYLAILALALGAPFSAQRYRLSRTLWCGIRGGMRGSMLAYGLRALLYTLLVPLTLFQLAPWVQLRLAERRINAASFGSAQFRAQFHAGRVYGRFLLTLLGTMLLGAVVAGVTWLIAGPTLLADIQFMQENQGHMSPDTAREIGLHVGGLIAAAEIAFIVGAVFIGAMYQALVLRHMANHTTVGPMQLSGRFTARGLLGLWVGNILITVFTLGLGYPFALNRSVRYVTSNVGATGSLDPAALQQTEMAAPHFGEGLFQQLDHGGVF